MTLLLVLTPTHIALCGTVSILIVEGNLLRILSSKITSNALMLVIIGHFRVPWGKSIIDVTLSNYSLANKISDWKVENHLEVFDHFGITFTINDCINFRQQR